MCMFSYSACERMCHLSVILSYDRHNRKSSVGIDEATLFPPLSKYSLWKRVKFFQAETPVIQHTEPTFSHCVFSAFFIRAAKICQAEFFETDKFPFICIIAFECMAWCHISGNCFSELCIYIYRKTDNYSSCSKPIL